MESAAGGARNGDPEVDLQKKIFPGQAYPVLYAVYDMAGANRVENVATLEQSNGFSILGSRPEPGSIWSPNGHVRDKDGTFAAMLLAELQCYAKSQDLTLIELLDREIYSDPQIGFFFNYYEPEPYWGQFEGPTGMSKKINILRACEELRESVERGDDVALGGLLVRGVVAYRTGKYDILHRWRQYPDLPYYNGFPDEGIRFFLDDRRMNHLTVRPSGTSHCLRFHVQLHAGHMSGSELIQQKRASAELARAIVADVRKVTGA
jgi:phosphomannomutase